MRAPQSNRVQSPDEFQCLRFYSEYVAPQLSGLLGGDFWTRLILQTGNQQPFIKNAVIAIGAFGRILKVGGVLAKSSLLPRSGMTNDEAALQRNYVFALQEYHKFILGTRVHLSSQEDDKRLVLISCLLITCIERLQNHNQSALTQAARGLQIMQEWIRANAKPHNVEDSAKRGLLITTVPGVSSPAPLLIEDDIVHQFRQLKITSLAPPYCSGLDSIQPEKFESEEEEALNGMTPTFTDINDAMFYLELILKRSFHFIREVRNSTKFANSTLLVNFSDEELPLFEESPDPTDMRPLTPSVWEQRLQIHLRHNGHWDNAFQ